jgi:hypothetical protein
MAADDVAARARIVLQRIVERKRELKASDPACIVGAVELFMRTQAALSAAETEGDCCPGIAALYTKAQIELSQELLTAALDKGSSDVRAEWYARAHILSYMMEFAKASPSIYEAARALTTVDKGNGFAWVALFHAAWRRGPGLSTSRGSLRTATGTEYTGLRCGNVLGRMYRALEVLRLDREEYIRTLLIWTAQGQHELQILLLHGVALRWAAPARAEPDGAEAISLWAYLARLAFNIEPGMGGLGVRAASEFSRVYGVPRPATVKRLRELTGVSAESEAEYWERHATEGNMKMVMLAIRSAEAAILAGKLAPQIFDQLSGPEGPDLNHRQWEPFNGRSQGGVPAPEGRAAGDGEREEPNR